MNFGVIGPGNIGEVIVRKLRDAGHPVKMANSQGPESLKDLGAKTGAIPVSLEQVVQDVDVLFIVVPQKAIPELPKGLLNKARKETIVIDVGNYYPFRDGRIDELENGLTERVWVERQIGRPVIKVLNTIPSKALMAAGRPAGARDRVALPISGDNTEAKKIVAQLIDRLGFDSVDAGTIAESWRQQPGSPVLLHQSDEGGTSVVAKQSRPFFTCRQPREGIEGILPDKGCGLPSPNRSPSIGTNKRIKQ